MLHNNLSSRFSTISSQFFAIYIKYRGPILRVTSQALGSDDLTLDQSATSIQIIFPESAVTWHTFYKITTLSMFSSRMHNFEIQYQMFLMGNVSYIG